MKDFLNFMILMRENPWSRITCCFCDKRKNPETYIIKFLSNQREVILKKRMLGKKNFWYHLKKNVRWSNYEGKPLEPDYVLFLRQKKEPRNLYYQIFIEPKGSYLKEKDAWKEKFDNISF